MVYDRLSTIFSALSDPTRRAILAGLAQGQASVQEVARPFAMSLPAVSRHLKILERAGLIERGREAQWRPCRLRAEPLKEVAEWAIRYQRFWDESFDRLNVYLREVQAKENRPRCRKKTKGQLEQTSTKGKTHVRKNQSRKQSGC
jgi:DNA-binding transcriptional ArsR family regulator